MEPARTDTFHREAQSEAETGLLDPGAAVAIPRHRFTVHDFARLGEAERVPHDIVRTGRPGT